MFAIIEDGAHQYKVEEGQVLQLEKRDEAEGTKIVFKEVLLYSDEKNTEVGTPFVPYAVEAEVLEHFKGDKIRVVKKKSKKRYEKVQGHRQNYTKVKVLKITAAKVTAKKAAPKKAEEKAPAKKPAAKKTTAKKA